MRKGLIWMAAAAVASQMVAARAETLGDALASAYKTSGLLAQNQAVLRAADEDVAVAVGSLMPVVSFIAQAQDSASLKYGPGSTFSPAPDSFGWSNALGATLQLNAQMTLYDFGRNAANINVAKETVLATELSLTNVEQQVLLGAAQAYVAVTLQQETVAMQQSNVRVVTQALRAAKDKFDVGEVTKTDVSQAEAQLAAAKAQLAASEGALALARESYKAAVGHYPTNLAPLPKAPSLPGSLNAALAIATKTNPLILSAQHQSRAADFRVEGAKDNLFPIVKGGVSATVSPTTVDPGTSPKSGFTTDSTTKNLTAFVSLSQTIYQGGQLSAFYRKSLDAQDQARAGVQQTAVQVAQSVGNAWANLSVAAASISAGDQQVTAAQAALDGVKQEFDVGSRTTLDVLNAQQALLNAEAARLQAVSNLYNGQYTLLSTMGLMTAEHLHLGVPLYDPKAYYNAVKDAPATSAQGARLDKIMKLMGRD